MWINLFICAVLLSKNDYEHISQTHTTPLSDVFFKNSKHLRDIKYALHPHIFVQIIYSAYTRYLLVFSTFLGNIFVKFVFLFFFSK